MTRLKTKRLQLMKKFLVFSDNPKQTKRVPLIIYLHGAGGRGDNIERIKTSVIPLLKGVEKFIDESSSDDEEMGRFMCEPGI